MLSMSLTTAKNRFNFIFMLLMAVLLFIAPTYYQPNPGGEGLFLPFNNIVWLTLSFIVGVGILHILQSQQFRLPSISLSMLFFLATTTLLGLVKSVSMPEDWLFRSLALWGGILFYFSLAQFHLSGRQRDRLLLWVLIAASLQSLIGLAQILITDPPLTWIPISVGIPRGIFQQQNLNASFCATGLVIGTYLVSRPYFISFKPFQQGLVWIAIGLNITTIVTSGSRIGLLAAVIGVLVMLTSRFQQFRRKPLHVAYLLITIIGFGLVANQLPNTAGLDKGISKFSQTNVRLMIYDSSLELIEENPILGYGIGQFQSVWHEKKIDYLKRHPNAAILTDRLSHPHNELLYWAIEGGLAAVIGILVMVATYLWRCFQLGWKRGLSYLAMLMPIAAHTQVELPFYISQLHWALFVLLIYQVGQHQIRKFKINLSSTARAIVLSMAILIPVATSIFTAKNLVAMDLTMRFIRGIDSSIEKLLLAGENLYFSRWNTAIQMQVIFQTALKNDDQETLKQYITMAMDSLQITPDPNVMKNLSIAYHKVGQYDASHRVLLKASAIYPKTGSIIQARNEIIELDREKGLFDKYWKQKTEVQ